jgi:hypothetical protein
MLTRRQSRLARSTALIALCTGAAAAATLPLHAPSLLRAIVVITVFASLTVALRDRLPRLRVPMS